MPCFSKRGVRHGRSAFTAFVIGCVFSASAQPAHTQSPPNCAQDSLYHALDFWTGEWEVHAGASLAGTSRIERVLDGCAVIEHWRAANGGEGKSLFWVDPVAKRWKQVWVTGTPGAIKEKQQIERFADGGIRFQGEVLLREVRVLDRTTLTPLSGGEVRQLIEVSRDGGETWQVSFDGRYIRRGTDDVSAQGFDVIETTIAEIHRAFRERRLTARQLVQIYIDRIEAYDGRGPALNALTVIHPRALEVADSLDRLFATTGAFAGALHGIPVIVKENYDTYDLPTTAGSRALAGSVPPDDAFMVRRIRAAGGIVLAKSNMAEWAFSPLETVGSAHPGYTFNPYALNRVPAGSSGGTAAAVTANLGAVGLGTDTGNSIRGPSSHTALVGIRPTLGLTSRDGIIPLYLERDVGGPMTRTVEDAARVLDVLAGRDPADAATAASEGHVPPTYTAFLDRDALRGARLGVATRLLQRQGTDPEVVERFREAIEDLRRLGATVIDDVDVWVLDSVRVTLCSSFARDLEQYLATLGPDAPVKTVGEIVESGRYHVTVERRLRNALTDSTAGDAARCTEAAASKQRFQEGLRAVMAAHRLDALIYPTWGNPPRLIGDLTTPANDNSQNLAPPSGFPAITVPMGRVRDDKLPAGLQILGDAWSEGKLFGYAYAYEQATRHRRAPSWNE
ncbi:MAG: amidase [Gemmatimonadetes bacterium]|nr:amidase [Gemmatimonadota bacterium]